MKNIAVLLIGPLLVGCTSFNRLKIDTDGERTISMLSAGGQVRIATVSVQHFNFTLTGIDKSFLYGEDNQIGINEIAIIDRKELTVAGYVTAVGMIALASNVLC